MAIGRKSRDCTEGDRGGEMASFCMEGDIMTQSSLYTGTWLLGFLLMG